MRIKKTSLVLLILVFSNNIRAQDSSAHPTSVAETFDLDVQLEPGASFLCKNTYKEKISQTFMGTLLEGTQTIVNSLELVVSGVQNHETQVKATFLRIQIENSQNVNPIFYDSQDGRDGPLASLNALIGKTFLITLNTQGAIVDLKGLESLFDSIPQDGTLSVFGPSYMEAALNNTFFIFNEQPVDIGEAWSNSARLPLTKDLVLKLTPTYTLESLSEDLIWLNIESDIKGEAGLKGQLQGNYEVDRYTGLVSYGNVNYQLSNPTLQGQDDTGVNIEIDNIVEISKQSD